MTVFEALVLGVVQGAAEFLPVSSSGHLVLLQRIFGITEPALVFDTAVHCGTLAAVIFVLRRDIWNILRRIIQPLTLYLIISTIPAVIAALLFDDFIEAAFASGTYLGYCFLITSALLLISEKLSSREKLRQGSDNAIPARGQANMNWKDSLIIGLLQALAVMPGISRSGAAISAGLSRKLDRDFSARFSFLLSIPVILGALVLQMKDLIKGTSELVPAESVLAEPALAEASAGIGFLPIAVGTVSAGVVGFFAIKLALKIVREHSLRVFALYTGILGILVLIDKFGTKLFF